MSEGAGAERRLLPHLRLDDLLAEVRTRLEALVTTRDRVHNLLEAVVSIGGELELETVLRRVVEAATTLAGARYGALGVVGDEGRLVRFIPVGVGEEEVGRIGSWPEGRGVLGLLIKDPRPLRLADIAEHPKAYGFPAGHPPMRGFLGVPIRVRDEVFGHLYLAEKSGGAEFEEEDEAVVVALAAAAGLAIENAHLYDEARRREAWVGASSQVTTALLSGMGSREVIELIARQGRDMSGADLAGIALPAPEADVLTVEVAVGDHAEEVRGFTVPVATSLMGRVFTSGVPAVFSNVDHDPATAPLFSRFPLGPILLVPIGGAGAVRGVLAVANRSGRSPPSDATRRMLHAFAGQAAVALELAERRRSSERLVVLEERDRIAKDLHDVVIQRLFASAMTLMSAAKLTDKPAVEVRVRRAVDDLDETIREIRSTIFALQAPSQETRGSLRTRILASVQTAAEMLDFSPGVRLDGLLDTVVPDEVGGQLLVVLRETLSNVVRHARAHHGSVAVSVGEEVILKVEDDGVGIPATAPRSGLRNLAARAAALGGTCEARPREHGGTVVEWRVPLASETASDTGH